MAVLNNVYYCLICLAAFFEITLNHGIVSRGNGDEFGNQSKQVNINENKFKDRFKRQEDSTEKRYETFNPCDDGFVTLDRYVGLPYEEENYFNGTIHLEKYKNSIPHAELEITLDNPATITLDPRVARVRVLPDRKFYIRTHAMPPTVNFTARAPSMKPFPNLATVVLAGRTLCLQPKKWIPTLLGPPPESDQVSKRFLLPEEQALARSCGRPRIDHVALVTGGRETELGDWPWHVAVYVTGTVGRKYRCGGSIISQSAILTAAHCSVIGARPIPARALAVVAGKYRLNGTDQNTKEYQVAQVIIHNRFSPRTMKNDIALLKLIENITYTDYIQPVCLWSFKQLSKNYLFGGNGTLVGWGSTAPRAALSETLRSGTMELVSDTTCLLSYPVFYEKFLSEDTFCAGSLGPRGTSACTGDSGGALVFAVTLGDGVTSWFLRGIVSVSVAVRGACDVTHYSVFTDAARYDAWVRAYATDVASSSA